MRTRAESFRAAIQDNGDCHMARVARSISVNPAQPSSEHYLMRLESVGFRAIVISSQPPCVILAVKSIKRPLIQRTLPRDFRFLNLLTNAATNSSPN